METITAYEVAEQIARITYLAPGTMAEPLNGVVDHDKLAVLVDDMAERGWQGAPIVVDGDNAFTGSHRIAAAVKLWNEHAIDVQIPRVEITDLCELYDLNWDAILEDHEGSFYDAAASLRFALPREVVDYLGYDVDGAL